MRTYRSQPIGTVPRARELRRNASDPERRLLRALRATLPDLKWRHQVPIGDYYADLLCFSERLVIEVDGETHAQLAAYDARRTRFIEGEGYRMIRFTNNDVMQDLDGVTTQVLFLVQGRRSQATRAGGIGKAREEGSAA